MLIKFKNKTAQQVSLPGPLPRLGSSEEKTIEITPQEYDVVRESLDRLIAANVVDVVSAEMPGGRYTKFTFDDDNGRILFENVVIAPLVGGGNVLGPGSATDTALARFSGISGQLIQDSSATLDNAGNLSTPGTVNGRNVVSDGIKLDSINQALIPTTTQKAALTGTSGSPSISNKYVTDQDPRNTNSRPPSGAASGQLSGSYPSPLVIGIRETGGPTNLTVGVISNGQVLARSGTGIVGITPVMTDEFVKVDGSDTATGHLADKLTATSGATLTVLNVGGNEKLQISAPPLTSALPANVTKSSALVGSATSAARADHKHDTTTASAVGISASSANTEGSLTPLARSDHTHAIDTANGTITTVKAGDTADAGVASGLSKRDHRHAVSTGTPGTISVADAADEGASTALARADHTHAVGTPSAPSDVTKATANAGSNSIPARADHKHDISTIAPIQGIGGGNTEGSSTSLARADHDHTIHETGGPTDLTVGVVADGQAIKRSGTALVGYTPTDSDEHVKISATDTTTDYLTNKIAASGGISLSILTPSGNEKLQISAPALTTSAPADVTKSAAQAGSGTTAAKSDHKHDISTGTPSSLSGDSTNYEGLATSLARSDHTHVIDTTNGTITTVKAGDTALPGSASGVTRRDHQHAVSTGTPGSVTIAASADEGSATSLARSDHRHSVGTPAAPADVTKATADAGSSSTPARSDHKHDVTTSTAIAIGGGNSEGSGTALARANHDHKLKETGGPTELTIAAIADGQVLKRSGTTIIGVAVGSGDVTGPASSVDLGVPVFNGTTGKIIKDSGLRNYGASASDPTPPPAPSDGDQYYNTALKKWMVYDSSRTKWLSQETITMPWGRSGNTAAGSYYRGMDSITFTASLGFVAIYNGTIIEFGYTRSDNDAATFNITANGVSVASIPSAAVKGTSSTLNANVSSSDVLGVFNQAGGNTVSDAQGWVMIKWRA